MKLNNKGFAISSILYLILVMAVILIALILAILSGRKLILDKTKNETMNSITNEVSYTYREVLQELKMAAQNYLNTRSTLEKDYVDSVSISYLKNNNYINIVDEEILEFYNLNDKYIGYSNNGSDYNYYLGKEKEYSGTTIKSNKEILDVLDYQIEGNSYQEVTIQGKNLLDLSTLKPGYVSITDFSYSGTSENIYKTVEMYLKKGSYTINFDKNVYVVRAISESLHDSNYALSNLSSPVRDVTSLSFDLLEDEKVYISFRDNVNSTEWDSNSKVWLTEGRNPTVYTEFIPEKPSPNYPSKIQSVGDLIIDNTNLNYYKYQLPIKVSGNNLVNFDNSLTFNVMTKKVYLEPGTYTITNGNVINQSNNVPYLIFYDNTKGFSVYPNQSKTITIENPETRIYMYSNGYNSIASQGVTSTIENLMVAKEKNIKYETYVEPIVTNIYLNEPLRKIQNEKDYIKFNEQNLTINITEDIFEGSESWSLPSIQLNNYSSYRLVSYFKKYPVQNFMCSHFKTSTQVKYDTLNKDIATSYNDTDELIINVSKDVANANNQTSLDNWKNWIINQKNKSNPLKIIQILDESHQESIELPNIDIRYGTKNIDIDTEIKPSNMNFKIVEKIVEIN